MTSSLKIALAQANPTLGDIDGNLALAREFRAEAEAGGADIVLFPELFITGYPPEDLVMKRSFVAAARAAVEELAAETADGGPALLMTMPWLENGQLYNSVGLLDAGQVQAVRHKCELPNYGVFDEKRLFAVGPQPGPVNFRDVRLGLMVCEDMWFPEVTETLEESGAEILLVPNGSPYDIGKLDIRLNHAVARVTESGLPLVYVNQVGGQDELVFDGGSFVLNADCRRPIQLDGWRERLVVSEWRRGDDGRWACADGERAPASSRLEAIYRTMVLGLRDYVGKNRFPGVVLGLSGGVDSALSAAVAVDALGPDRVHCVMMPSRYTSSESLEDAAACAELLGTRLDTVSIAPAVDAYETMMGPLFDGRPADVTEENLQSRARALVVMAISNKFGPMVLTTGNKSEMSVGYATLYGDMCGGYSVLKDVYKTTCFELSHWRNQHHNPDFLGPAGRIMPERVIVKPPTAELRPDQKDEDSLPPYPVLDGILERLVEQEMSVSEIVAAGFERETVNRVQNLLYIAEYKRRQSPPGVKITARNFGRDRRYPITNGYRDRG
ncbi:NAD+ synthase [Oceanibacterium hippocampi]|uniref:Glutamine-dependent NAD(+) synthetase n=1 Tax=Oceanibacterium hippocampi TaxID=745714 RepID=A0A1Y5T6K4_9PROT|nr:NAD+ synthase [Oceanibacterium hippocampi]SLN56530.1 Glutamine-dependent NAD(+) synthetase [Oceanibacterium hippocampi]